MQRVRHHLAIPQRGDGTPGQYPRVAEGVVEGRHQDPIALELGTTAPTDRCDGRDLSADLQRGPELVDRLLGLARLEEYAVTIDPGRCPFDREHAHDRPVSTAV